MAFGSHSAEAVSVFPFLTTRPSEPGEGEDEEKDHIMYLSPSNSQTPSPRVYHCPSTTHQDAIQTLQRDSSKIPT